MKGLFVFVLGLAAVDAFTARSLRLTYRSSSVNRDVPNQPLALPSLPHAMTTLISNPSNTKATISLIVSTLAGIKMDRRLPGSGIVTTLTAATILSSLRWAPTHHALYSASWSVFLPASLVFLILSLPIPRQGSNTHTSRSIARLAMPFAIACAGSLIGCTCSFFIFTNSATAASIRMVPHDARLAASCLAASFIGGSVNFLATAAALPATSSKTLIGSMATADVLVMAVYLSSLAACIKSKSLTSWFMGGGADSTRSAAPSNGGDLSGATQAPAKGLSLGSFPTAVTAILAATGIVQLTNRLEPRLSPVVPGMACALITLVTPLVQRVLARLVDAATLQATSSRLFEFSFLLLFASMGMSTNLAGVLQNAPVCFGFSCLALAVHGVVTLVGTKMYREVVDPSITLADTLVASNAAIGGAATAAAFAGQAPSSERRGLVVAGTVWGIAGYAIGTTAGLTLYRLLSRYISPLL